MNYKQAEEKTFLILSALATVFAISMLFYIVITIATHALPSLTWYFITTPESETPGIGQGILNAVVGTVVISLFATIIATPFAMGTAIYLSRYAPKNRMVNIFRFLLEVLSGTPSIVLGIFALLVFVYYLKPLTGGYSLIAGAVALAILIVPVIERSVETAIYAIDRELEEQSYALGATKWQTIRHVTIPCAIAGIITGIILGFGRAAEESAVVILTAGYSQYMPEIAVKANDNFLLGYKIYPFNDLVGTLPYSVYHAYENQSVIPLSNGFAAAFILISFVLCVNIFAKIILSYSFSGNTGNTDGIKIDKWIRNFKAAAFKSDRMLITKGTNATNLHREDKLTEPEMSIGQGSLKAFLSNFLKPGRVSVRTGPTERINSTLLNEDRKPVVKIFLHTLLPFAIPAILLGAIAFLATIPPLHNALGQASPSLARLFGTGLALIITAAGLVFGLLLAKKGGAFRAKNRRTGFAVAGAGICLLLVAGIVCAGSAPGFFNTGEQPAAGSPDGSGQSTATASGADRQAQLQALMKQMESEESSSTTEGELQGSTAQARSPDIQPAGPAANRSVPVIPVKDALSVGESYWWGDAQHTCRATIYDYEVLPFYFWWWIDYNRFVPQIPPAGKSYLVIFVRIENVGTQSAVIPSANLFNVSYRGNSSGRLPYLNTTLISTWQYSQLGSETRREQYYQWIREIGQDKRDYAYLTGEDLFKGNESALANVTTTVTTLSTVTATSTVNATNKSAYNGAYLKPGRSQAVDGYLIFEVPAAAAKDLNNTYVDVAFNSLSRARWRLG